MARTGPIIVVEDDQDDQYIFEEVIRSIGVSNPILFFDSGINALQYLQTTTDQPFVILSDMNIPKMSGMELRQAIEDDPALKKKAIPFVFVSTDASPIGVRQAYDFTVQGFFKKPDSMEEFKKMLALLFNYWELCRHPNSLAP